jgi:septin family protein
MENQTKTKAKDLIIIGAQGSGKTTLANKLASKHHRSRVIGIDFGRHSTETWKQIKAQLSIHRQGVELIIVEGVRCWQNIEDLIFQLDTHFEGDMSLRPRLIFTSLSNLNNARLLLSDKYEIIRL